MRKGSSLIEFTLTAIVWVPLLLGCFGIGLMLVRDIQVTEVARDAARLYAYGTDFSQPSGQALLQELAGSYSLASGGNAVEILSTVMLAGYSDCAASGLTPGNCPNDGQIVFTRRIIVGNSSLRASNFGSVDPGLADSSGNIPATNAGGSGYLQNAALRVSNFAQLMTPYAGQPGYISEFYLSTPDLHFPGFVDGKGIYSYSIF